MNKDRFQDNCGMPTADYFRMVQQKDRTWNQRFEPAPVLRKRDVVRAAQRIIKIHQLSKIISSQVNEAAQKAWDRRRR